MARSPSAKITKTKRWRRVRRRVLERDGYRCQHCGKPGRLEVDHKTPINRGGSAWDMVNLQALCRGCHIRKTAQENRKRVPQEVQRWRDLVDRLTRG